MQSKVNRLARALREVLSPETLNALGRGSGQSVRLRVVTPSRLLMALLGAFAGGACESIADVLREFNRQQRTSTRYKAFYNRLARPGFPVFVRAVLNNVLAGLTVRALDPVPGSPLVQFDDIVIHDGSSFAIKDALASVFPGRFKRNSPAAVELHASISGFRDEVFSIALAPDKKPERPFLPKPKELKGKLLLADRGYCSIGFFHEVDRQGGHFIIRVTKSFDQWIVAEWRGNRRCALRRPRRISQVIGKRYSGRPRDFEVKHKLLDLRSFRIVLIPGKEAHGTRLATNLSPAQFPLHVVARTYRLRWQVELLFKEWKSYANLRAFDTTNRHIVQGLIWASLLVSALKRFLAHAAQATHSVEISTRRAAMCLSPWVRQLASALAHEGGRLRRTLADTLAYLAGNAPRANPRRDAITGRRAAGLQPAATP